MEEKKDNKKKIIILAVITFIIILLSTSFAFFVWNSNKENNINVSLSLSGLDAYIHYNKGTDVLTGTLLPSTDYSGGISTEIELWKDPSAASRNIYGHIYLDITTIGTNLANEPALKWAITSNGEVLNTGDFVGKAQGNSIRLKINIPLSTTKQLFKIYIWLDESMEINDAIEGETISTIVRAEASEIMYTAANDIESLLKSNPETMNNDDPDGNIRYMGANPNNYIDIGETGTIKKWQDIYLLATIPSQEQCNDFVVNACTKYYGLLGFSSEEECNNAMSSFLPNFNVSSWQEFSDNYCVVETGTILWRIIGVFDIKSSEGGQPEKRLKIIRDKSLGPSYWGNSNINDWSTSMLEDYLNNTYYNSLNYKTQSLIGDAYWNLGGTSSFHDASNGLASHFYGYERGTTVYSGHPTYWIGKMGLMYPSDYGYATSGGTIINRESCLAKELYNWGSSSYSDCKNNNYLYIFGSPKWTITPESSLPDYALYISGNGIITGNNVYPTDPNDYLSYPVLYLKSTVQVTGGSGTSTDPFTLGQ